MSIQSASPRSYIVKRCLGMIPVIFGVIITAFMIIHIAPGDPVSILAGGYTTPEYLEMMRQKLGLDKPLYEQLFYYIAAVVRGDLGYSFVYRQSVLILILERLPATLLLVGTALMFSFVVGIFLGVTSSKKLYSVTDNVTTTISLLGYSLPVFWLGQMLLLVFSINLGWLPVCGMESPRGELTGIEYVLDILRHLALPALTLGTIHLALVTRLTRGSMLEVLRMDFITTARSKGLDENAVLYKHGLRNALLPVVTVMGMQLGLMLAGAVMTETVFAWPGLGRLMYEAIYARDYPVLMGNFIFIVISVIVANLITDILYAFLDPRIRY